MRDRNGYELNTGATIAAPLYGNGDFVATVQCAFNFGWDCDNSAATAATIVGVMRGHSWMMAQGWQIVDRYRNTTRDDMPMDETISSFADRLTLLAELVICEAGGTRTFSNAHATHNIPVEPPGCVLPLDPLQATVETSRESWATEVEDSVLYATSEQQRARGAYVAICLDLADSLRSRHPEDWQGAVRALNAHENVAQVLYHHSDVPAAPSLKAKAIAAGLLRPADSKPLW